MKNEARLTKSGGIVLLILIIFIDTLSIEISFSAFSIISETSEICVLLLQEPFTWIVISLGLLLLMGEMWSSGARQCIEFIKIFLFITKFQVLFLYHLWRGGGGIILK